ncbi:MAG: hypothetical protein M1839_006393 [Geoglossum umbratile]|nr:MAG: hypothetical protein M1839_006393 [Geoglossum umbratile]
MAIVDSSIASLLSSLTSSLHSAIPSVPNETAILPPKDGISLLDTKNELLLSYLQNLVFLILVKLRNGSLLEKPKVGSGGEEGEADGGLGAEVVKKLVELRVYLEKGVRPLEGRLKYQIDKVLRAAGDAARVEAQETNDNGIGGVNGSAGGEDSDDETTHRDKSAPTSAPDDLSYRPNPAAFARPIAKPPADSTDPSTTVYRPPRITPTALPWPTQPYPRRPLKSRTLDEFLETELSTTPSALPSIGSTIVSGGRRSKSITERAAEAERAAYEEANFVRLPNLSKKERRMQQSRGEAGYGGEEWRGLGEGLERVERLTRKKRDGGVGGVLQKSRKRKAVDGLGRVEVGEMFERKRSKVLGGRRDRGKR